MRYIRRLTVAAVLLGLVWAQVARADTEALEAIPAKAPVVVHVRGWESLKEKVETLVWKAMPRLQAAVLLKEFDNLVGRLLTDRKLTGLSREGPVFVVLPELSKPAAGDPPPLVLMARVKDYQNFVKDLLTPDEQKTLEKTPAGYQSAVLAGVPVYLVQRGAYAVITPSKKLAGVFQRKTRDNLADKLGRDLADRFVQADLALLVNIEPIIEQVGDNLAEAVGQFKGDMVLYMIKQGWNRELAEELFGVLFDGFMQLSKDSQFALLTAGVLPDGLKLHGEIQVKARSKSAAFLKELGGELCDFKELERLPLDFLTYSATAGSVPDVSKTLASGDKKKLPIKKLFQPKKDLHNTKEISCTGSRILGKGIKVLSLKDPGEHVRQSLKEYSSDIFDLLPVKGKPKLVEDAESYRNFRLHQFEVELDEVKMAKLSGVTPRGYKHLRGDGSVEWFGTDGKVAVHLKAKNWQDARAMLDRFLDDKETLGKQPGYQNLRKHMPARCTSLYFEELSSYYQQMAAFSVANVAGEFGIDKLPRIAKPLGGPPQYYGWSAILQEQQIAIDVWLPVFMATEYFRVMAPLVGR